MHYFLITHFNSLNQKVLVLDTTKDKGRVHKVVQIRRVVHEK